MWRRSWKCVNSALRCRSAGGGEEEEGRIPSTHESSAEEEEEEVQVSSIESGYI